MLPCMSTDQRGYLLEGESFCGNEAALEYDHLLSDTYPKMLYAIGIQSMY